MTAHPRRAGTTPRQFTTATKAWFGHQEYAMHWQDTGASDQSGQTAGDQGWESLAAEEDRLDWLENQPSPQSTMTEALRVFMACGVAMFAFILTLQVLLRSA